MKHQRFWKVDLIDLFEEWGSDLSTFLMTVLMFLALALPVIIPALIMWYLFNDQLAGILLSARS